MFEKLKQNKELWDLFTKKEEYNAPVLDKHQRFPYIASKYKNILEPKVSKFLIENGFKFEYPENKKFAVCLTHDIDDIYPSWKYRIFTSFKFGLKLKFKNTYDRFFKKENPYWNFREIIELEKKYNAKSSFYFMTAEKDIHGFRYRINDLKDVLKYIIENDCEVGLHGGYYSYNNLKKIKNEKKKLEKIISRKVIGYRNHFLRFKVPDTWRLLYKAGFKYDTTFSYADMIGFRNGMCHPFKPYDLGTNEKIDIIEIPLIIMDGTLFEYMKLDINEAWKISKKLIGIVERYNGVLTVLWHNTSFDDIFYKGWNAVYKKILSYCYNENAWMTNGEEIHKWWMKNEY